MHDGRAEYQKVALSRRRERVASYSTLRAARAPVCAPVFCPRRHPLPFCEPVPIGGSLVKALALCGMAVALAAGVPCFGAGVVVDAKEAELPIVLKLLAAQGCATLRAHPDLAKEEITFAVSQIGRTAAVRWLCRSCNLALIRGKSGRGIVVARPSSARAMVEEYRVSRLAPAEEMGQGLVAFVRSVFLAAYQQREEDEAGELKPDLDVKCEKGSLKVLAPRSVQREVRALLKAVARAKERGNVATLTVEYATYDLGLFGSGHSARPRPMAGSVSLQLATVPAPQAAAELTSKTSVSFFVDPWDKDLAEAKVSLEADGLAVSKVAKNIAGQLGAELLWYDGAWLFVRAARKPLFESLQVWVHNVSGEFAKRPVADFAEWAAKRINLPEGLPYAVERVGDRLLTSMPESLHKPLADTLKGGRFGPGMKPGERPREGRHRPGGPRRGRH